MLRIVLTSDQEQELLQTFKETLDIRLRDRVQAVLMAHRKRPRHQIAEDLAIDQSTLYRWLKSWQEGGLEGLIIQWHTGPVPLIDDTHAETIQQWVKGGPASCGLDRANWTFEELATHFFQKTGIKVSETCMREFCHKHGIRPYRPTYRYLRGNPEKQAIARVELMDLKKKPRQER